MAISSCTSCGGDSSTREAYMSVTKEAAQQRQQQEPAVTQPAPVQPAQPGLFVLDIRA